MKFSELLDYDVRPHIMGIVGNQADVETVDMFLMLWKLAGMQYGDLNLLIDVNPSRLAYISSTIYSFLANKPNLMIWRQMDQFKDIKDFKKKHIQEDSRSINQRTTGSNNGTFNEGYAGYSSSNQANNYRRDTSSTDSNGTYTSNDSFNRTLTDDDPELAIRALKTNVTLKIEEEIRHYVMNYCEVII